MSWSLTINGTTKTLAQWRVNGVRLRRLNLAGDTLTFTAPRAGFDDLLCDYGDTVALLDADGVTWFTGTSQTIPDSVEPASRLQTYSIVSPWRWLAENIFQQPWYNGTLYTSHIITTDTVGGTIRAVLDYAIANGAAFTYTLSDLTALAVSPPTNEFTEKTCSQVILEQLQFAPDTVTWFDYTTATPTLRFQQRGSLTAVSLQMADDDGAATSTNPKVSVLQLTARPDLQVPSVKIMFEVIEEVDGQQYLIPSTEVYPVGSTGREDGAFNATLTVQGRTVQNVFGELECETIDTTSLDWWKAHAPQLRDSRLTILTGPTDVVRYDRDGNVLETIYLRELLPGGGAIAPWMEDDDGNPLEWQTEIIKAKFATQTISDSDVINIDDEKEVSLEIVTTTAPDGVSTYSAVASVDAGDPLPVGLAAYLYASMSELHYEGNFVLQQSECDGVVSIGNVVNLLGARTAHETMRALVQEVTFDIDAGLTNIQCGPPRHLSLTDVLALLQRFRVRRRWTNPDTQDTGEVGGSGSGGDLELGKASGNTNTIPGTSVDSRYMVKSGDVKITSDATTGIFEVTEANSIKLKKQGHLLISGPDGAGLGGVEMKLEDCAGRTLRIQEIGVCVNGVNKRTLVLRSEIY